MLCLELGDVVLIVFLLAMLGALLVVLHRSR
jgi:hypothetical protein